MVRDEVLAITFILILQGRKRRNMAKVIVDTHRRVSKALASYAVDTCSVSLIIKFTDSLIRVIL